MAELVSGSISMGLGGFLAARSESQYYKAQASRERQLFFDNPDLMDEEVLDIVIDMGGSTETASHFIQDLRRQPKQMINFIIRFGRGLEEPADNRQLTSALTIGSGYFFGGFVPLMPYFFTSTVITGLLISVVVMLFTLFWFGYLKARISMGSECGTWTCVSEGLQMVLVGSLAAGSAWVLVYLIDR
ncbi:DEKNAAC103685 [Brettanomyces naardenensis]|uniref:DEKNAAC103685 n=1 Tax=Brettanomyces naardenensis TaxID=13370 RepID=A0A448YNI5_BRENA|nr:DEKNAAC103685 [Brettanomyces naardenensis]